MLTKRDLVNLVINPIDEVEKCRAKNLMSVTFVVDDAGVNRRSYDRIKYGDTENPAWPGILKLQRWVLKMHGMEAMAPPAVKILK